ncbi:acyl-ACP thioesterase [Moorella thermoacetica]|uniref:acyl-[acyl-carrier-protein] thioesterase n=1 Tax=Neomoorella thermoacetica TaxID=1525 RepID=UPI00069E2207|nr:acyl-ACP thioesterase domain-containing protein [Moorella thermoacetica]AKX95048.1 acyl-ACP thioesterase [Moorella thermoacetica]
MPTSTYQRDYEVRYYETNFLLEASPVTILGYLEETATLHSETAGIGINKLKAAGRGWVVYRYHLQMERYPRWREHITITTWVENFQRCFAHRDFYIHDAGGNLIGRAASVWVFLDIHKKKPLRIPPQVTGAYGLYPEVAVPGVFTDLPSLEKPATAGEFTVRMADLDTNHHANNKRYIGWILEGVPLEVHRTAFPATIEVLYKKDARYGEHIHCECQEIPAVEGDRCYLHRLSCPERDLELTLARTTWRKRR